MHTHTCERTRRSPFASVNFNKHFYKLYSPYARNGNSLSIYGRTRLAPYVRALQMHAIIFPVDNYIFCVQLNQMLVAERTDGATRRTKKRSSLSSFAVRITFPAGMNCVRKLRRIPSPPPPPPRLAGYFIKRTQVFRSCPFRIESSPPTHASMLQNVTKGHPSHHPKRHHEQHCIPPCWPTRPRYQTILNQARTSLRTANTANTANGRFPRGARTGAQQPRLPLHRI